LKAELVEDQLKLPLQFDVLGQAREEVHWIIFIQPLVSTAQTKFAVTQEGGERRAIQLFRDEKRLASD